MVKPEPSFREDLRSALAAWARFPWLPVVSVALSLLTSFLPEPLWFVAFLATILYVGWVGTERICYLRAFRSKSITTGELWRLTFAFVMRYATLGLVIAVPFAPIIIWGASRATEGDSLEPRAELLVVGWIASVAIDVCLTFVTPALSFTTRRVGNALWL